MAPEGSSTAPEERCRCGRAIAADDLYCPACGTPTTGHGRVTGSDPADEPLLLLGGHSGRSTNETTVRTGPRLLPRVVGIGLALVGVVLMWSLFRQPSSEVAPEPANEEAVADTALDEEDDGEDPPRDAEDEAEVAEETDERDDGPTTTAGNSGSTSSDPSGTGADDGAALTPPLLGEETGLVLAVGREGDATLRILDLDSGDLQELSGIPERPIGHIGSSLLLHNENTGRTSRLDLDDVEAGAVPLVEPSNGYLEVIEITEDRIWVIGDGEGGPTLRSLDINGVVVEDLDVPLVGSIGYGPWSVSRPSTLLYDPAGGLYRREGDSYELIAEGQVLAAGERIAVIRQCDETLECQLRWYDQRSSGVIGFPAPPPSDGQGFYQLLGGDRWLAYFDWQNREGQLIEVATARVTRQLDMERFFRFGPGRTAITEDGRWLADVVDGMLVVVDLDSGTEWSTGIRGAGAHPIFVE